MACSAPPGRTSSWDPAIRDRLSLHSPAQAGKASAV
jgi:hypothetical protein